MFFFFFRGEGGGGGLVGGNVCFKKKMFSELCFAWATFLTTTEYVVGKCFVGTLKPIINSGL